RDARAVWIETICDRLQAHPVQQIGKVFVIYRENEVEAQGTRRKAQETEKPQEAPGAGRQKGARHEAQGAGRSGRAAGTRRRPLAHIAPSAQRRFYTYFTSTISSSFTPPGVRTSTTSPENFPMRALAIGEE